MGAPRIGDPCADVSGSDRGLLCTVQGITWVMSRMKKAGTPPDTTSYNTCATARSHGPSPPLLP